MLAIEAVGLRKAYRDRAVLTGVDLAVEAGRVFSLLGPNGAGKTTIVRILSTLLTADAGTVRVAGFDVQRDRTEVRRRISLTGQYAAVDDVQTGAENLYMIGRLAGLSRVDSRRRAAELLERFDLASLGGQRVGQYSGGLRRKLDLAAGLVGRPSVIFLDEPTTGLDPRSRQEAWQVIAALVRDGVTVFLTTQYLDEADHLADHIAVIDEGRIVAEGTASELKRRVAEQRLDLTFVDAAAFVAGQELLGVRVAQADPSRCSLSIPTDGSAAHVRAVLDEIDPLSTMVRQFAVHAATLDDVFLALTGTTTPKETVHV